MQRICFALLAIAFLPVCLADIVCGDELDQRAITSFIEFHCADCHGDGGDEGGFRLEDLSHELEDQAAFDRWVRVYDRVNAGEMPPPADADIKLQERTQFLKTLQQPLLDAHQASKSTVLRRLNRHEYENTLNDLFGTNADLAKMLPEDGRSHEFDNVGDALAVSMVHLDQYIKAAELVLDEASAKTLKPTEVTTTTADYASTREGEEFIGKIWGKAADGATVFFERVGYPTGMLRGTEVKPPGRYRVKITGYAYRSDNPITFRVGGTSFLRGTDKPTYGFFQFSPGAPMTVEFETYIKPRYMILIEPWGLSTQGYNLRKGGLEGYDGPGLAINKVELTGPIFDEFPTRGHELLFEGFERKIIQQAKWNRDAIFEIESPTLDRDVRASLLRIANRAFRRPVEPDEIAPYFELFQAEIQAGSSNEVALKTAVSAILCSPDFLFLREPDGGLDDHALASRLSYFLTRTAPDTTLRQVADNRQLASDEDQLLEQTRRLLTHDHNRRFINDFCDAWLNLREIEFTSPDQVLFPEYDDYLHESAVKETHAFVSKLIEDNLPIRNLVQSDFAMLNERLADHYGIKGVIGPEIRPVDLPANSVRGGILSHTSVLKVSANGTNTSPVVRGVWVMDRIMGEPPQPPPPGIPGVEPDIRGSTTLREMLDKHRSMDSCRACHAKIDPPGFALECFNPIGGYRDRFRSLGDGERTKEKVNGRQVRYRLGPHVDASGELPDGEAFADFQQFRSLLLADEEQIARAFTTKLLTFATGREMGFSDRAIIDSILANTKQDGYRVRDLIENIVLSEAFRTK